ncbi:MAG: Mpo1-like protein [Woeseiaceae bacterium]|nr:Mpo1-like protein [Woeseiaceae bacterium]
MKRESRLMEMLTGYAAAHQHPVNIAVHMVGIPCIMFGALVALSWLTIGFMDVKINLAWLVLLGFFLFYLTLDAPFALVFLVVGAVMTVIATQVGQLPLETSGSVAAATFIGGYVAQFIGHAIEKSQPVLLKHPIQANLAAPFFTVVEAFKLLGLRDDLFIQVQRRIAERRAEEAARH